MFLSLRFLQTAVEGALALESPEGESEGYLLEKGLKETIQELKATVLTLLKFGQVDPSTQGSPETTAGAAAAEKTAASAPSS